MAGGANGHTPLFLKPAFINQKTGGFLISQKNVCLAGDMIDNGSGVPFGVGQKLLKISRFGPRYNLGHAVHVFAGTRLHQATCVLASFVRYIVAIGLKMMTETFHEGHKTPPDASKRLRGRISFPPGFTVLSPGLIS